MKKIIFLIFIPFIPFILYSQAENPLIIKSMLENNRILFQSTERLTERRYTIYIADQPKGNITIQAGGRVNSFTEYKYEYTAITTPNVINDLKSGQKFSISAPRQKKMPVYTDAFTKEKTEYERSIISKPDNREMVLVTGGITLIGSDLGQPDESPVHQIMIKLFYIDTYEVSNRDYLVYCMSSSVAPPISWHKGEFPQIKADYPVLVTYHEALSYAKWAGKRLPTEFEWERAANGVAASQKVVTEQGIIEKPFKTRFPWGNDLHRWINYSDYWNSKSETTERQELLPIDYFKNTNISFYGAVNMAGNAAEWTSSWYRAYPGSTHETIRFGTQVKVIRGGDYKSNPEEITISSRSFGGLPDLRSDNRAGFRCVKDIETISKN
ncbi:MAG: SUMF1/EgtB/PvdO family nonheme iron enzyme [Spirochaetes bacterium]|jgi:formylglycine-generating enzyme required for sulfatase activity|nr:SUMF1/EgtB/PvdO family nonheme iron enzyme [Spirochaetota bacterium]